MALPIRKPGQGGGFLNGSTVTFLDYAYKVNKRGNTKKGDPFKTYSVELTVQPDGGEAVKQFLDAGFLYGNNDVSKDGKDITGSDNYSLDGSTQLGQMVLSLVEGDGLRVPEETLGNLRNLRGILGLRAVLSRQVDVEATIARGEYKLGAKAAKTATRDELFDAGKKEAKKGSKNEGKKYPLDKLTVAEVVTLPDGKGKPAKANKANKATTAATTAPAEAPAAEADTDAVDTALRAILAGAKEQTLARTAISGAVVKYRLAAKLSADQGETIRKQLISDAYIADAIERGVIVSVGEGKSASITLVPTE